MIFRSPLFLAASLAPTVSAITTAFVDGSYYSPTVKTLNGTYAGVHNPYYNQDLFLGIPFAQPPIGDLRLRAPQSLNTSWSGSRNATAYGAFCVGYGSIASAYTDFMSEDCLTLNIVRPVGQGSDLPVVIWIYGGSFVEGGSADPRFNLSYTVQEAANSGKPHIAISINYRLQGKAHIQLHLISLDFAAKYSQVGDFFTVKKFRKMDRQISDSGINGDMALHWVQENVANFGGDPSKVTIWGESAGAGSVGVHIMAYNGRDDKLFRAAIMESGALIKPAKYPTPHEWEPVYQNLTRATGCSDATNSLACLRSLPFTKLNAVFNSSTMTEADWGPMLDGDLIADRGFNQLKTAKFVKVPILIGTNFDEGTTFTSKGIDTDREFLQYLNSYGADNLSAENLMVLYPDIPAIGIPETLQGQPQLKKLGLQFKRAAAFLGDLQYQTPRRLTATAWAMNNITCFSYHFNVLTNGLTNETGSNHGAEIPFVFYNLDGSGYREIAEVNPFDGEPASYFDLARLMTRMWSNFIADLDPNHAGVESQYWPAYSVYNPQNYLFSVITTSYTEPDYYRAEAQAYISSIMSTVFGR
ncbi:triacylglycerol lipase [Penicillium odoratum]|uniref:triacylglycerol lipase n=1 Tax=Penicillium odoratum TaxID=1167516 RepID=UPI0025474F9F|nr:triacylglycerol lipase [Penicillium odoratum]KAJ5765926.1 triacylglycerol lipase [Penicillium odoratum]